MKILGEATDYDDLLAVIRTRVAALGLSCETIDDLAGFHSGYAGKLLAPAQTRRLGPFSLGPMMTVCGLKMILVEDEAVMLKMADRHVRRDERRVRAGIPRRKPVTAAQRRAIAKAAIAEIARRGGQKSGESRRSKMKQSQRSRIAKRAARARWNRRREKRTKPRSIGVTDTTTSRCSTA